MEVCGISGIDLLVASPPCQGFSRVGRGKLDFLAAKPGSFACDERNSLYQHAIRLLELLRPRIFLFENVTGVMHLRGRNVAEDVCDAVNTAGYIPRCTILNSAWYGVPQNRERVIIMGVRDDLGVMPEFPLKRFQLTINSGHYTVGQPIFTDWRNPEYFIDPRMIATTKPMADATSVQEAFDDLPPFTGHLDARRTNSSYRAIRKLFPPLDYAKEAENWYCKRMRVWDGRFNSEQVYDHFCRWTPRDFDTFARMKPDDRYPEALSVARQRYWEEVERFKSRKSFRMPSYEDYVPPYPDDCFEEKWRKLIPSQPSWTITAHLSKDTYSHIHFDSSQARAITIREAARIQSFPDAFHLEGNTGDAFRQIGNAVPPLMAQAVGEALTTILAKADEGSLLPNAIGAF